MFAKNLDPTVVRNEAMFLFVGSPDRQKDDSLQRPNFYL